ncbi:hypothetical protein EW146_g5590 [Bondarzewia mesenterica]|uniref:UspA domain-containing protein n=1 Tax=Bondarzewia mesenterica TaxID=1095465 RepID=A0A4S4LS15_9AGAM|nr:hypothetical protein EW146_g5590 [Bondarzewia mesenterica]
MYDSSQASLPLPSPQPLRSAMKHPSRPSTPCTSSPVNSPALRSSPLLPSQVNTSTANIAVPSPPPLHDFPHPFPLALRNSIPTYVLAISLAIHSDIASGANPAASMFSFTLSVKNEGYTRNRNTRVFLCAASADDSGRQALDWAIESLVQDGDELIVFRGIDQEDLDKDHDLVREEARELMRRTQERCMDLDHNRKLSIVVEFIAGKVTQTIDRLIALYRPDSIVVGTRSRGMMQTWGAAFGAPGMGSVSKYCLSHSPVPIIVVRPESKVRKTMEKRRADPKRGLHFDDRRLRPQRSNIASVPITPTLTQ